MAASDLLAGTVMDTSASLMNDTARTVYTYAAQLPYINLALRELQEYFELHSIPVTEQTSTVIQVDAGMTEIVYNGVGVPSLPDDMVEPQQLWERPRNSNPFVPMTKVDYLPHNLDGQEISSFIVFVWESQRIKLLPSNADNDIKIDYIRELFIPVVNEGSQINVTNAQTFLAYRTAALCAEFIERNITSANGLNNYALIALERATGITVKGKQSIMTRRRPFRSAYKGRG
jgi:hypothetical protein